MLNTIIDTIQVHITNEEVKTTWDYVKDYSFVITLFVGALLGFGVQRINDELKFRKTRRFFFHVLNDFNGGVSSQIDYYKTYLQDYEKENNFVPPLKVSMKFTLKSIGVVSLEDLFKIFVLRGKNSRQLDEYLVGINKIEDIIKSYKENENELHRSYERCMSKFSNILIELISSMDAFVSEMKNKKINTKEKDFIENIIKFGTIYDDLRKVEEDTPIIRIMKEFVKPFSDYLKEVNTQLFIHNVSALENSFFEFKDNRLNFGRKHKYDLECLVTIKKVNSNIISSYIKYQKK